MQIQHLTRWVLAVVALSVAAATAGACSGDDAKGPSEGVSNAGDYRGVLVTPPLEKPALTFTDTSGRPYDLVRETEGTVTLLYLGYTHCPDVCPMHMVDLNAVLAKLPGDISAKIKVVFVTVDPERDTPEALGRWLGAFNSSFIGLTPDAPTLARLLYEFGMGEPHRTDLGSGNYAVSHAAYVMAFTPDNLAHTVYPSGVTREDWAHDLTRLVKEGWKPS